jgi:hypothetical protein
LGCFVTCAKDYVARMASGATAIFLGTIHHACEIEVGGGRFSWHCDECDADICNRCLQETRNSWACKGSKSRIEDVGDEIDLGGMWTMFFTGDDNRQEFCAPSIRVLHRLAT